MSYSTYDRLRHQMDQAAASQDPARIMADATALHTYLRTMLERAWDDNRTLMEVIRDLRAEVARLEGER